MTCVNALLIRIIRLFYYKMAITRQNAQHSLRRGYCSRPKKGINDTLMTAIFHDGIINLLEIYMAFEAEKRLIVF